MSEAPPGDTVAIRKTHLYAVAGLLVGVLMGFAVARALTPAAPVASIDLSRVAPGAATPAAATITVSTEGRPSRGPANARVTIVEFTDYQCPFCKRHFEQTLPAIVKQYGDRVRYVVRNLPLTNIHPQAQKAAEAAECAHDQGKFWEYHDELFRDQKKLDPASLAALAQTVGLDAGRFEACLASGAKSEIVARDVSDAQSYGVTGTPTFFVNGERLVGAQPLTKWQALIEEKLRTQ